MLHARIGVGLQLIPLAVLRRGSGPDGYVEIELPEVVHISAVGMLVRISQIIVFVIQITQNPLAAVVIFPEHPLRAVEQKVKPFL